MIDSIDSIIMIQSEIESVSQPKSMSDSTDSRHYSLLTTTVYTTDYSLV